MNNYKRRKFYQSFQNAFKGIWLCIKSERNMRFHTIATAYLLVFVNFFGLERVEYALLFIMIGLVICCEMLNTAVEKICDFDCDKKDRRIGVIKDIAAGAVLVVSIVAVIVAVMILYRPEKILEIISFLFENSWYLIALVISAVISVIYIFSGPIGIKKYFHKLKQKRKLKDKIKR